MGDPVTTGMAIGAAGGALTNKKNPLKGAMMGAALGGAGGYAAPGLFGGAAAAAPAGATGAAGGSLASMGGAAGVTGSATGLGGVGGSSLSSSFPMFAGEMGGMSGLAPTAGGFAGASALPGMTASQLAGTEAMTSFSPAIGQFGDALPVEQLSGGTGFAGNIFAAPQTPSGSLSTTGLFNKVLTGITEPSDSRNAAGGMAAMQGMGMLRGQEQQRAAAQQGVFAPAPPLNPQAGAGQSFMSGAPGMSINSMPSGLSPTANRFAFARRRPSNDYSDYGLG